MHALQIDHLLARRHITLTENFCIIVGQRENTIKFARDPFQMTMRDQTDNKYRAAQGDGREQQELEVDKSMKLDHVLLSLLARKPYSGYELGKWLATDGYFVRPNTDMPQIYRTLARLTGQDFVQFEIVDSAKGPAAKMYRLTPAGANELFAWIESPYEPPARFTDEIFWIRFTCGGILKPSSLIPLIDTEIAHREKQIANFRYRDRTLVLETGEIPIDYDLATTILDDAFNFNTASTDIWLDWLRKERVRLVKILGEPKST